MSGMLSTPLGRYVVSVGAYLQRAGVSPRLLNHCTKDRVLIFETQEGRRKVTAMLRAAQVSILGPDLWNASYNSLLLAEMPEKTCLVSYTDDVAALIAAHDVELA